MCVGEPEVAQSPYLARVFDLPSASVGEGLDAVVGVEQEAAPAAGPGACRGAEALPERLRLIEQAVNAGVGQGVDQALSPSGDDLRGGFLMAALQDVLDLHAQGHRKAAQIDVF